MPSSELEPRVRVAGGALTRLFGVRWMSRGHRAAMVAAVAGAMTLSLTAPALADPRKPTPSAGEVSRAQQAAQAAASDVGRMQAKLARAQAQLQALMDDAERAVEAYNGARYELDLAAQAAAEAGARAASARADLAAAQLEVGRFASASYRMGGDLGSFASMLDADGPQDLMNQANDLANVAASNNRALARVEAARIVATVLDDQATTALGAQTAAAERVRLAKLDAQAKVAAQTDQIDGLTTLAHRLTQRLASARAKAGDLSQQRKEGLAAKAAREKAAREAAAAAAAASSGSGGNGGGGGGGGGDDSGNSSGWSPSFAGGTQYGNQAGAAKAIAYAEKQLGKPYLYAAAGPNSFDCSGLTMMAWRAGGVTLPHWSVAQFAQAKKIPAAEARPGDLLFYAYDIGDPGTIHHVALYIGNGQMIHAPHTGDVVRIATSTPRA